MKQILIFIMLISVISSCSSDSVVDLGSNKDGNTKALDLDSKDDIKNDSKDDIDKTNDGTIKCVDEYYKSEISPYIQNCKVCHTDEGVAKNTRLVFGDNLKINQKTLIDYMLAHQNNIIQKNSGVLEHKGGDTFDQSVIDKFTNFKSFSTNIPLCKLSQNRSLSPLYIDDLVLMDYKEALDKLVQRVYDRSATEDELASVSTKSDLESYMDTMMKDEKFYDWLMHEFNDIFQVDQFLGTAGVTYFPTSNAKWFMKYNKTDKQKYNYLMHGINYGHVRQILELISHVVKEKRDFGEILTADYIMVNPFTAVSWDLNNSEHYDQSKWGSFMYDQGDDYKKYSWYDFKEAKIAIYGVEKKKAREFSVHDNNLTHYPHAGILSDLMFLWKYQTTVTNRNRHRTSKIAKFFLDLDIEKIAIRSAGDVGVGNTYTNPTTQNPNCTVCHYVMDPIAGAYHNFNHVYGSLFYRPRPGGWFDINEKDMFSIGYSIIDVMPDKYRNNSLQYLAKKITSDERFDRTMVKHFYKALTSKELLSFPKGSNLNYNELLQAYNLQEQIVNQIIKRWKDSGRNAQELIKDIVTSELFRTKDISTDVHTLELDRVTASAKLITSERIYNKLENKFKTFSHFSNFNSQWHELQTTYKLLYGSIDNNLQSERDYEMNGIKAGIQKRVAFDVGCETTTFDFYSKLSPHVISKYVDENTTPTSAENIVKIKKNIQYLHEYLHNEKLPLDSDELGFTYDLLLQTYNDFKANDNKNVSCATYEAYGEDKKNNIFASRGEFFRDDPNYMIRTWSVVMNYLVDDFYFYFDLDSKGEK